MVASRSPSPFPDLYVQTPNLGQSVGNRRLDSWKEIAAYLRRDERTVRRWEKDGLPVHRKVMNKKAAIFAYTEEIDAWWHSAVAEESAVKSSEMADPRLESGHRWWFRRGAILGTVTLPWSPQA